MDMKYDRMVAITQEESKQKIQLAQDTIAIMLSGREKITVAELVKRTGLSRGFFYKNEIIRAKLDKAVDEQKKVPPIIMQKDSDAQRVGEELSKLQKINEELEKQNEVLKNQNVQLQSEVERLNQRLARKELSLLKKL